MHREDNSKYLLYIEPPAIEKLDTPIDDDLTKMMEMALSKSKKGLAGYSDLSDMGDGYDLDFSDMGDGFTCERIPSFCEGGGYRGVHRTECGQNSSNTDLLLENGMITNSLAAFYLKWYRYSIPESEMRKVKELDDFYKTSKHRFTK